MTTPWLAAPRSLEGLAVLPGASVVVSLACAVVEPCDGGVIVPFEGVDMFEVVILLDAVCPVVVTLEWEEVLEVIVEFAAVPSPDAI